MAGDLFTLQETYCAPQAVVIARGVANARGLVTKQGPVVFDTSGHPAQLVVDFGREIVGRVTLEIEALTETTLQLYYGEDLPEALRRENYTGGWYNLPTDSFTFSPGRHTVVNPGRRAFRYVHVFMPPESGAMRVYDATATLVHYPVQHEGTFICSDPLLNRAWEISAYTTKCCMQQYYEEGVKRDGLLWIGDYRIQYLCNALLFGDVELARHSLRLIAASQHDQGDLTGHLPSNATRAGAYQHPWNINYMPCVPEVLQDGVLVNYEADFISGLKEYYDFTGDADLVRELWPTVCRVLDALRTLDLTTVTPGLAVIGFHIDHQSDRVGGAHSALAACCYVAVRDAIALARLVGDDATRAQCEQDLAELHTLCHGYYAPELGFFRDEYDALRPSLNANALLSMTGVAGDRTACRDLLHRVAAQPDVYHPTGGISFFWWLQGLFQAGMVDVGLAEMRRYWGQMLANDATSCWEGVDATLPGIERFDGAAISHCHGWSAGPAYFLPAYVLGVQPAAPGFTRVRIQPNLADLDFAEGTIPTPLGEIVIRWERLPQLHGTITLPPGMTGDVVLPDGRVQEISDGQTSIAVQS